jgi:hypothetical protein
MSEQAGWTCGACGSAWSGLRKFCGECGAKRPEVKPAVSEDDAAALAIVNASRGVIGRTAVKSLGDVDQLTREAAISAAHAARELFGKEAATLRATLAAMTRDRDAWRDIHEREMKPFEALGAYLQENGGKPSAHIGDEAARILREQQAEIAELKAEVSDYKGLYGVASAEIAEWREKLDAARAYAVQRETRLQGQFDEAIRQRDELRRKLEAQEPAKRCCCNDACGDVRSPPGCELHQKENVRLSGLPTVGEPVEINVDLSTSEWRKFSVEEHHVAFSVPGRAMRFYAEDEGFHWRRVQPVTQPTQAPSDAVPTFPAPGSLSCCVYCYGQSVSDASCVGRHGSGPCVRARVPVAQPTLHDLAMRTLATQSKCDHVGKGRFMRAGMYGGVITTCVGCGEVIPPPSDLAAFDGPEVREAPLVKNAAGSAKDEPRMERLEALLREHLGDEAGDELSECDAAIVECARSIAIDYAEGVARAAGITKDAT